MSIVPDDKDWTWVLQRPCPECGFDASAIARDEVAVLIRENAVDWQTVFDKHPALRERTRPEVWSPLEYGCHVRDVFRLYDHRLALMLAQNNPTYPNWDQDATAVADSYGEQDPQQVIIELRLAAQTLATSFARVRDDQWDRTGARSDGATFTVDSFARYLVHDPIHHLNDVRGDAVNLPTPADRIHRPSG